jgi:predicted permease
VIKNPLIAAALLAMIFGVTGLRLPQLLYTPLSRLGSAATPIAMVTLGGILSFGQIRRDVRELTITVLGKLVILPVAGILIAILLGFRQDSLVVIMTAFGCPTAVASAAMAQEMG